MLLRCPRAILLICFAAGFTLGLFCRIQANRQSLVSLGQAAEQITAVSGLLLDDPRTTSTGRGMGTMDLHFVTGSGRVQTSAKGKTLVFFTEGSLPRLREFGRGSEVFVEGNFIIREDGGGGTPMFRAVSVHIARGGGSIDQLRTRCRLALIDTFGKAGKWGGLALALLIGIRDNLDTELARQYQLAGCSYILALSGMHLAIVSSLIAFLLKRPLGLKAAAALGAVFVLLYVFLVGAQPSLTRAAIMYIIGSAAIIGAFPSNPALLLAMSFIFQIVFQSESGDSISFLLSYLALAGILSVGQSFAFFLKGKLPDIIASPLSASLGAFFATMAVSFYFFGTVSLAGIAAGLLMVPLTTVFMIGAIARLASTFVLPFLNPVLDYALSVVYRILEKIAYTAGKFPPVVMPPNALVLIVSIFLPIVILAAHQYIVIKRYSIERFD
ncbi:hypothetical protein AGMMS50212_11700 [Spirochaetia bacterium]|nr:hypothetical protein AGMMS50212_11700 [Spirochaetia bacterium]